MKFSIIIPVYNVEKYIKKCLESIDNQTYQKFEAIIVDDGSPDKSSEIIKRFIKNKKNFKYYKKENGGLSDARNYGIKYASGDYILFVDSDDYISTELLNELNKEIEKNKDEVIKFNGQYIENNQEKLMKKNNFESIETKKALPVLLKDELFEPAWLYCYNKRFWDKNNFKYKKGKIHEDYGLTPLVLAKAKKISSINHCGYNYVIRENSIMTEEGSEKEYRKFLDMLYFFDTNIPIIDKENYDNEIKKYLKSFYANGLITKAKALSKNNQKKAILEIKKRKLDKYLLKDSFKRKLKSTLYKMSVSLFIKWS